LPAGCRGGGRRSFGGGGAAAQCGGDAGEQGEGGAEGEDDDQAGVEGPGDQGREELASGQGLLLRCRQVGQGAAGLEEVLDRVDAQLGGEQG
jgi:hypothetical protein